MNKSVIVSCPFCHGTMDVDVDSGKVKDKWEPSEKGGDRMASALKKLEESKQKRKGLFDLKKGELESQRRKLAEDFSKRLEKAKDGDDGEKPVRPFDLD